MRNKILLLIAALIMIIDFSSCTMHVEHGTPYKVWRPSGRNHSHWGREKTQNNRHRYWGRHRSGPRPYRHRGHYNY